MKKLSSVTLACLLVTAVGALAETYPSKPITFIVPYAAGGQLDMIIRTLLERMPEPLGQTLIVDNVTGAGGSLGTGRAARAAPDGYTVAMGNWNTHVANGAIYSLQYDVLRDFEPVA